jgi:DNA-binding beta-propeller fold protein YncE
MTLNRSNMVRALLVISVMASLTILSRTIQADTGNCGGATTTLPFTDVQGNVFFCQIAAAYFSGLANGTSATTYSPSDNVTREQMAAFTTRTLDQSLKRGSRRAALDQFWTTASSNSLALTMVEDGPIGVKSDGADIWVANLISDTVSRVRASDGRLLETWTGATDAYSVLCAMGKVFVTGAASTGRLYQIDPTQPAGMVTTLSEDLGGYPRGIAFDGQRIWTANSTDGSLSIITLNPTSVTNVKTGLTSARGILYDGANIWVTEYVSFGVGKLHKLDSSGAILQSVDVGGDPRHMAFDGTNIWVPNVGSGTVSVVRATGSLSGTVIATLSGNGLAGPIQAAFDGERILVTNLSDNSVSLWKATDLAPLGSVSTGAGTEPFGACSDGVNFWITLYGTDRLARF